MEKITIQPFLPKGHAVTIIVFSLFFGRLAGIPSDGIPYPIFSYAALVSSLAAVGLLVSGAYYFRPLRVEKTFADVV